MVDGGRALQPVLYSLALEEATGRPVLEDVSTTRRRPGDTATSAFR